MHFPAFFTRAAMCLALPCLAALPAAARPLAPAMSCAAVSGLVAAQGAAVISTSASTYDRFIRSRYGCDTGNYAQPAYVQTRDVQACFIGYSCTANPPADYFPHRRGVF